MIKILTFLLGLAVFDYVVYILMGGGQVKEQEDLLQRIHPHRHSSYPEEYVLNHFNPHAPKEQKHKWIRDFVNRAKGVRLLSEREQRAEKHADEIINKLLK